MCSRLHLASPQMRATTVTPHGRLDLTPSTPRACPSTTASTRIIAQVQPQIRHNIGGEAHPGGHRHWIARSFSITQGMVFPTVALDLLPQGPSGARPRSNKQTGTRTAAKFRWSVHKRLPSGNIQFICPQCAGRIVTNRTTHKKNVKPNKSAPFVQVSGSGTCCKGLATVHH